MSDYPTAAELKQGHSPDRGFPCPQCKRAGMLSQQTHPNKEGRYIRTRWCRWCGCTVRVEEKIISYVKKHSVVE